MNTNSTPVDPNEGMDLLQTASAFQFSGAAIDQLTGGSSKYTLVTIVVDISGSVSPYAAAIEGLLSEIVQACQKDPAADTLMLRVLLFNQDLTELHGFKLLGSINPTDYKGKISCGGSTALYDAMLNAVESAEAYAKQLLTQAYMSNAVTFVTTDGENNASSSGASDVLKANNRVVKQESLESSNTILLGLTNDPAFGPYLKTVETDCGCNQSMVVGALSVGGPNVNKGKIAKLAGFVSHSVSSTAQALGTGGASKNIPASLVI